MLGSSSTKRRFVWRCRFVTLESFLWPLNSIWSLSESFGSKGVDGLDHSSSDSSFSSHHSSSFSSSTPPFFQQQLKMNRSRDSTMTIALAKAPVPYGETIQIQFLNCSVQLAFWNFRAYFFPASLTRWLNSVELLWGFFCGLAQPQSV